MIESLFDPDILLYCPYIVTAVGTQAEHKPDGNSVQVLGPTVLLHHMKVLVYSKLVCQG